MKLMEHHFSLETVEDNFVASLHVTLPVARPITGFMVNCSSSKSEVSVNTSLLIKMLIGN